jgi:hypothetical protein
LFDHFPTDVQWSWTRFGRQDLEQIRYINYSYWNELSKGTGSPLDAARTIRSGVTIFNVPNDGFWQAYQWLKSGKPFPPLIMVTDHDAGIFTILEGHLRMTAYGLAPDRFRNVTVLLGTCQKGKLIKWFGAKPITGL